MPVSKIFNLMPSVAIVFEVANDAEEKRSPDALPGSLPLEIIFIETSLSRVAMPDSELEGGS